MPEYTYRLPWHRRLAFGIGHVLNDLCASMWFSYLLVYLHNVLNFSNVNAGYLMLIGQVADAISTPLVGYESDHTNGFCKYTKRKSWHLIGTVCVIATFPFLFMPCIDCSHAENWRQFIYYAPFVVIFQFGWASTQINHLSLIPELTPNEGERVELNAIRYAFTVCSNLAVYLIAWVLLTHGNVSTSLSSADIPNFTTLVLIVVGVGTFFSIVFHIFTQERRCNDFLHGVSSRVANGGMRWKDWLKEFQFYMVALIYMCTRLVVNVSQIYLPMYLTDSLGLSKQYIALVPLAVYISGFVVSFLMRPINRIAGRKLTYLLGVLLILGCCTWLFFLRTATDLEVFGAAALLGAGGSTMLVTSLSLTADLIGHHTESGAFVYGAMSFTDKLSNGIAVVTIQHLHPCVGQACCEACVWFYRDMMVFVPGGFACLSLVLLIVIAPVTIGDLRRRDSHVGEKTPLLGAMDTDDEQVSCCSYMCCANLSSAPYAHKTLCDSCGQAACYQRRLSVEANESAPQTNYQCINSMVQSEGRCWRNDPLLETVTNHYNSQEECASGSPNERESRAELSGNLINRECELKTCAGIAVEDRGVHHKEGGKKLASNGDLQKSDTQPAANSELRIEANVSAPQTNIQCINSMVQSEGRCWRNDPPLETETNHYDSLKECARGSPSESEPRANLSGTSTNNKCELKTCANSIAIKDRGVRQKKDKKAGKKSATNDDLQNGDKVSDTNGELQVCADVHA